MFYLDSNEAKTIQNRLARDAFNIGKAELQSLRRSNVSNTWHMITDPDSPVKRVGTDQTQTNQFKNWFGKSKTVDADGKPLLMYRGAAFDPLKQPNGEGVIKPEAYFTTDPNYAKRLS